MGTEKTTAGTDGTPRDRTFGSFTPAEAVIDQVGRDLAPFMARAYFEQLQRDLERHLRLKRDGGPTDLSGSASNVGPFAPQSSGLP